MRWGNWNGKPGAKWTLGLALSFGFVFVLGVVASIVTLHAAADKQLQGEAILARLRANVAQLSVIEYHWRVNGGITTGLDSKAGEGSGEQRLNNLVDSMRIDALRVQSLGKNGNVGPTLITKTDAYVRAIQRLRALYLERNNVQAFAYDDNNVDNAYTALTLELNVAGGALRRASLSARALATFGTLIALLLQFGILAFATLRLSASREKSAVLTAQQATLALSERRLGVLIGRVNAVVSVVDESGAFTYTSPQTERYFGFIPHGIADLLPRCDDEGRALQSMLAQPSGELELVLNIKDEVRHFFLQSQSFFDDPAVQGQVLVWHDVTITKQAQNAIEEARDSAVHLSKLKSEFLANMSHEIRTPMNGVLGMVDLLLDTDLTLVQSDYTETIRSCGTALMSLLNDILDFSKLESSRLILEHIAFDPSHVAEECADLVRATASKKNLELIVALDDVDWIQGDPTRLRQVILNLLSNAVKFTSEGEVIVRVQALGKKDNRTRLRFSVSDCGIGIPEDKIQDIFGAFVQVDGSTTRVYGGTGLGLSISKQIVHLMGGELSVASEVGKGSEFSFEIEAEIAVPEPKALTSQPLEGKHILVVDDSETNLQVLAGLLSRWGCKVDRALNGEEAMRHVAATTFDLIILDNLMPGLDGIALARVFQGQGLKTPLVLLTSVGAPLDHASLQKIGIRQCLSKPARRPDLLQALVQTLAPSPLTLQEAKQEEPRLETRVLVVEDNPVNQTVAKKLLTNLGCSVEIASGGFQALEMAGAERYDLIFMDCLMPDMDGYETTRQLRTSSTPWLREIPIIALTASAMEGDRAKCLAAGMNDYVSKPVNRQALAQILVHYASPKAA